MSKEVINMVRRIRTEKAVDCPKENRIVPITAIQAGANPNQFTCRKCPFLKRESCYSVSCDYPSKIPLLR